MSPRVQLFQERPVWTRTAIFNQFSAGEVREIVKLVHLTSASLVY